MSDNATEILKELRLEDVIRDQDNNARNLDPLERKAVTKAREHLAEFQELCDHLAKTNVPLGNRIVQITEWWKLRGIVGEWYYSVEQGVEILLSKRVVCAEDVT
jgi:hypothetical protein